MQLPLNYIHQYFPPFAQQYIEEGSVAANDSPILTQILQEF